MSETQAAPTAAMQALSEMMMEGVNRELNLRAQLIVTMRHLREAEARADKAEAERTPPPTPDPDPTVKSK